MESGREGSAALGSNSLGRKGIGMGGAEGSGGAEKNARGGKLSVGGAAGALALGRVLFWGDVRNGPEMGLWMFHVERLRLGEIGREFGFSMFHVEQTA